MAIDILLILSRAWTGKQWAFDRDDFSDYSKLKWLDTSPKPTLAEIEAAEAGVLADITAEQAEKQAIVDAIATKLPSLAKINTKINKLPLDEATKAFLADLSEVLYHHIKGTTNGGS